jgi:predicted acyl esterase
MAHTSSTGFVARALGAVHAKAFGLPAARNSYTITTGVRVPMRDGAQLLVDHYAPRGTARGTVLIKVS